MDAAEVRRAFTSFFTERAHQAVESAGLVPHDPRAPLFTNAGMNQFIPYFLGEEKAPWPRATSVQKCVRVRGKHDDIDLVGRTARHLTFFEMLGNFSFGDYFKERAIPLAWELLTGPMGLDGERLWVSVYTDDAEAEQIWRDAVGVPAERIQRLGSDNFWEMGETGPCGPCSELYFDRGEKWGPAGGPAEGGEERYVELWNLVFMQYDRLADGTLEPLPRPNIDTGAGLERLLAVLQGAPSVWETDVLQPVIARAESLTGRSYEGSYGPEATVDVALRILADHARAVAFLVADGVFPSNEDRGYVLRRLIRRAVRQAYVLGVERPVMAGLVEAVVETMGGAYPELVRNAGTLCELAEREEARFVSTLRSGLAVLDRELAEGVVKLPGEVAFRLHDTHGFPIELTREIAAERGAAVDEAGFEEYMARQRSLSAASARATTMAAGDTAAYRDILDEHGTTAFVGYEHLEAESTVIAVLQGCEARDGAGATVELFLDATPFYAEAGGQVGDTGWIETTGGRARVIDTTYALPGLVRHVARLEEGRVAPGEVARAHVDAERRAAIRRNHTGTHLLHWALREVLGEHVKQQGSLVAPDRLRFDFTHYAPVSPDEMRQVEDLVNRAVIADEPVEVRVISKRSAEEAGAIAFFEDKYGEQVRVVAAGSESLELCGGTHVERLGQIGPLQVISEGSIGSNLRRIEAVTGLAVLERARAIERALAEAAGLLRVAPEEVPVALERRLSEIRELQSRLRSAEQADLADRARRIASGADGDWVVARVDGLSPKQLLELAAEVRQAGGLRTVFLAGSPDGASASLAALVTKGGSPSAGELISRSAPVVGGGGGGKDAERAVGGGRDASGIDAALELVRGVLRK
jgi:alanyl-tRNA synthetase